MRTAHKKNAGRARTIKIFYYFMQHSKLTEYILIALEAVIRDFCVY